MRVALGGNVRTRLCPETIPIRVHMYVFAHVCARASGYAYKSGLPAREMYSEAEVASTYRRTSSSSIPSVVTACALLPFRAFLRYLVPRSLAGSSVPFPLPFFQPLVRPCVCARKNVANKRARARRPPERSDKRASDSKNRIGRTMKSFEQPFCIAVDVAERDGTV